MSEELELNELLVIRRNKLDELRALGVDPFGQKYERTHLAKPILDTYSEQTKEELDASAIEVRIAGRIMQKRGMGKTSFAHIQDISGKIQIYVRKDVVNELEFKAYEVLDIGDIIGVSGHVFKTQTGETSIKVQSLVVLTKSIYPLPDKFHGLKDVEMRYRQRYVDLIMSEEVKETFILRSKIIQSMRRYLDHAG